jgi:hypothetical protein
LRGRGKAARIHFRLALNGLTNGAEGSAVASLVIALITVAAVAGLLRLKVDDSLAELFRTNTPEFDLRRYDRRFPSSNTTRARGRRRQIASDARRADGLRRRDQRVATGRWRHRACFDALGAVKAGREWLCRADRAR